MFLEMVLEGADLGDSPLPCVTWEPWHLTWAMARYLWFPKWVFLKPTKKHEGLARGVL